MFRNCGPDIQKLQPFAPMRHLLIVLLPFCCFACSSLHQTTQPATAPSARATTQPAGEVEVSLDRYHGAIPGIDHVLIISVDGLRPDLLLRGDTPNMHHLYQTGAFTFWARTTAVSITLPSHVSMLTGVVPEVHAISWNADLPFKEPVYPAVPTLFELAKLAHLTTAMAAGKHKFVVFERPGALDWEFLVSAKHTAQNDPTEPPDPKVDATVTSMPWRLFESTSRS